MGKRRRLKICVHCVIFNYVNKGQRQNTGRDKPLKVGTSVSPFFFLLSCAFQSMISIMLLLQLSKTINFKENFHE